MAKPAAKTPHAYLHDMLEAARLIHGYMAGVTFDDFWRNSEKRDAVTLRISVLGESAHKIDKGTEAALPSIPFKSIRGMRNRIAHDYGAVDFKIVWAVTQTEIEPLIAALDAYFQTRPASPPRA
ncbi:MAG: HepT-like ribonuclease domain-containing protein [Opitutaceae bacterium]